MGRRKFNLTERNIYALDYNCHPSGALASGLYRPLWRRSDPSSARDCRRCACYSADSRQTRALSESVFAPAVSVVHPHNRFCTPNRTPLYAALDLHSANNVLGSMDQEGTTSSKLKTCSVTPVSIAGIRPRIENGRNWVLLPFQIIYWQPGNRIRAIP